MDHKIKFYLGVGDTRVQSNWHGPGKKDRLDLKVSHLKHRQSVICQQAVVQKMLQEQGFQVDGCGVILKGQLFYPHRFPHRYRHQDSRHLLYRKKGHLGGGNRTHICPGRIRHQIYMYCH